MNNSPPWNTIAIVGVGLLGGSIGMALRGQGLAKRVIGIGRRASSLRKARMCGAVDATTTRLDRGVREAELVIVCTPVELIVPQARAIAASAPTGVLITDVGSIKSDICQSLAGKLPHEATFIGSHPMAGSEKTGPEHATADLLAGRTVVITPTGGESDEAVGGITSFWRSLGANTLSMSPAEHDAAVAMTSHLPHIIAAALAAGTPPELLSVAGPGWSDTTRIAAGDVELWRQILTGNRSHALKAVDKFAKVLASFKAALKSGNEAELIRLLAAGKETRDALGS